MGSLPKVLPELKLPKILLKVFSRCRDMGRMDRPLEDAEECFDGVHVATVARVFAFSVVNGAVLVAALHKPFVGAPFVSVNGRSLRDMRFDLTLQRFAGCIWNDFRNHISV